VIIAKTGEAPVEMRRGGPSRTASVPSLSWSACPDHPAIHKIRRLRKMVLGTSAFAGRQARGDNGECVRVTGTSKLLADVDEARQPPDQHQTGGEQDHSMRGAGGTANSPSAC